MRSIEPWHWIAMGIIIVVTVAGLFGTGYPFAALFVAPIILIWAAFFYWWYGLRQLDG
jgi:hypothetical protein